MAMLDNFAVDAEVFDNPLINWQLFGLKFMGFIYTPTNRFKLFHFFRGVLVTISLFVLVCAQAHSAWLNSSDLDKLAPALGATIVYFNLSTRIIAFYWYGKIFCEMITSANIGVKKALATSLPNEIVILDSYKNYIKRIDYLLSLPFFVCLLYMYADGLHYTIIQGEDWSGQSENSTIPLASLFILYPTGSLGENIFVGCILSFYTAFFGVICVFTWPTFQAALMRCISFRLDIINYKLENMSEHSNNLIERRLHNVPQSQPQLLKYIFVTCVEDITEIKIFAKKYEQATNVAAFVESSTISALLCVQLYIISMDFSAALGLYGVWTFDTLGTLWLYFWHANEISLKSDQITNALYSFEWYEVPVSLQKDMVIFMSASIKPFIIKSGFINMNTNSLVTILKTSYSYFTLLRNFAT